jgi:hypothetical protein
MGSIVCFMGQGGRTGFIQFDIWVTEWWKEGRTGNSGEKKTEKVGRMPAHPHLSYLRFIMVSSPPFGNSPSLEACLSSQSRPIMLS